MRRWLAVGLLVGLAALGALVGGLVGARAPRGAGPTAPGPAVDAGLLTCDDAIFPSRPVWIGRAIRIASGRVTTAAPDSPVWSPLDDPQRGGAPIPLGVVGNEPLRLAVPEHERAHASLVFSSEVWQRAVAGRLPITAGELEVRFEPCPSATTGWLGGIVAERRRCVELDLYTGAATEPTRLRVALGVSGCP